MQTSDGISILLVDDDDLLISDAQALDLDGVTLRTRPSPLRPMYAHPRAPCAALLAGLRRRLAG